MVFYGCVLVRCNLVCVFYLRVVFVICICWYDKLEFVNGLDELGMGFVFCYFLYEVVVSGLKFLFGVVLDDIICG